MKAGKNEKSEGYQKFAAAQFYGMYLYNLIECLYFVENLTKEQFAGQYRPHLTIFNSARDALNPAVNADTLRNRLWTIDHYKFRYGAEHTFYWHTVLRRMGTHMNKYKFNYAVKAFLAYNVYAQVQGYNHQDSNFFLTEAQRGRHKVNVLLSSGALMGACLLF